MDGKGSIERERKGETAARKSDERERERVRRERDERAAPR